MAESHSSGTDSGFIQEPDDAGIDEPLVVITCAIYYADTAETPLSELPQCAARYRATDHDAPQHFRTNAPWRRIERLPAAEARALAGGTHPPAWTLIVCFSHPAAPVVVRLMPLKSVTGRVYAGICPELGCHFWWKAGRNTAALAEDQNTGGDTDSPVSTVRLDLPGGTVMGSPGNGTRRVGASLMLGWLRQLGDMAQLWETKIERLLGIAVPSSIERYGDAQSFLLAQRLLAGPAAGLERTKWSRQE